MRNQDYQMHLGCAKVEYTDWSVNITVYLSLKPATYKAMDNHWHQIVISTLARDGVFSLRSAFKSHMANQIVLHRELTWSRITQSPKAESVEMYRLLKGIVSDCELIYENEIKNYLYKQYIAK